MFGKPQGVAAFEKNSSVTAILRYQDFDATLNFTKGAAEYGALLYSKERNYFREIDITGIYEKEIDEFIKMLQTNQMPQPYEDLLKPIEVIDALLKSINCGKEIRL